MSHTVVCQNVWHKRTVVEVDGEEHVVRFEKDAEARVATAEVPAEVAEALAQQDGYEVEAGAPDAEELPLQTIKGIGPAYAEDLEDAGVDTLAALAEADAEAVAEEAGLDEEDVSEWIGRAKAHQ